MYSRGVIALLVAVVALCFTVVYASLVHAHSDIQFGALYTPSHPVVASSGNECVSIVSEIQPVLGKDETYQYSYRVVNACAERAFVSWALLNAVASDLTGTRAPFLLEIDAGTRREFRFSRASPPVHVKARVRIFMGIQDTTPSSTLRSGITIVAPGYLPQEARVQRLSH